MLFSSSFALFDKIANLTFILLFLHYFARECQNITQDLTPTTGLTPLLLALQLMITLMPNDKRRQNCRKERNTE